jgi:predicted transport protein
MKYATYPTYKPSPMPWLDEMPVGWDSASLRWMSRRYTGGTPDKGNEAYWEDGDIPWLNSGAVPMLPPHLGELVASLDGHVLSLGDDVQRKELKLYIAFKRLKNFATLVPQKNRLLLYLHIDPAQVVPPPTNGRDVSQQGHWGTGDLELALVSQADLEAAKPLILMAYEGRGAASIAALTVRSGC